MIYLQRILITIGVFLILNACSSGLFENKDDSWVFPLGRSLGEFSTVQCFINGQLAEENYTYDSCGGYWWIMPNENIRRGDSVLIRFVRREGEEPEFKENADMSSIFTEPTFYIDSDHDSIVDMADKLLVGMETNTEKATAIQRFVCRHVKYEVYNNSFKRKASETLQMKYGTCMNYSRLFIAICRAAGVPARSVWGVIDGQQGDGKYRYHHQWAEYMDHTGTWFQLDFGANQNTAVNTIYYTGLIYNAEANNVVKQREQYKNLIPKLYYHHDYPATYTGDLPFDLVYDCRPDSICFEFFTVL